MSVRPEELLRTKALASSGVSNLISTRWYANSAPQKTSYPCVVFGVESDNPVQHMTGATGYTQATISLGIYALKYEEAQAVAEKIRVACHAFKGNVTVSTETVKAGLLKLEKQMDSPVDTADGSDKPIFGITQTWLVSMEQATS